MSEITEVLAKLGKETRKRILLANEVSLERLETPSIGLNLALGGGFVYGRQILVYGNKSSGKSSMLLQMIAVAQREGKVCAWVDSEASFDPKWAARLGVDTDNLLISKAKSVAAMTADVMDFMNAGVDVVVVDSISALLSSAFFGKKDDELKEDLNETKQIGSHSRDLANACQMINYVNKKTLFVLISQVRNKITAVGAFPQPQGGYATSFFSSTVLKLWSSPREADQLTGDVVFADKIFTKPIGRKVDWTVEFNKTSPPNQTGDYLFYYDGYDVGIDTCGEIVDLAGKLEVIDVVNNTWYTIDGVKYQGKKKAIQALKAEPELYDKIKADVYARL